MLAARAPAAPLRLLDAKAEQRAAIALARVRLGDAAIVEAVLACDADALAPARLELVLRAAPSDAEAAAALAVAPGDAPRLSRASQFHRALAARVPDAARRLEGLSFAQRVEQSTRNLNDDFRVLARACEQIGRSERLARLLERVLALGNALNAGSARGGARGFLVTDLPAAARLRGAAGSEFPTLAHFLVASATRDGEAHTIDAEDEVPDLEAAARCQPDAWRAAVLDLRARAAALAAAVAAARAAAVPGCRFVATMAAPAERARAAVDALEERRLATEARFRRLAASFGDDDADRAAPAAFFGALAAFFADLRAARRDNGIELCSRFVTCCHVIV